MRYQDKKEEILLRAIWILLGVGLNTIELFIPRIPFLPWLKPGLANCITILWIVKFGIREAILYSLLRVWISSFYFGFSLITVTLSISGSISSTLGMGLLWKIFGRRKYLGTTGIAIAGATLHNTGQLLCVYFIFAKNMVIFYQLPFMFAASLLFGSITGLLAPYVVILTETKNYTLVDNYSLRTPIGKSKMSSIVFSIIIISVSSFLVVISNLLILSGFALGITIITFCALSFSPKIFIYPLKFNFFFLFTAFIYLFFSYGKNVSYLPIITYEGVRESVEQFLRLWTWLEAGLLLQRFNFNWIFFRILNLFFPAYSSTIFAGLIAFEYFPDVISFVKSKEARINFKNSKSLPSLKIFIVNLGNHILKIIGTK